MIDWEEIRDLQRAYFKSGVANLDVPPNAFIACLYKEAKKFSISNILSGGNMQTESVLLTKWGYDANDSISLLAIHNRFGTKKLKSFAIHGIFDEMIMYPYVNRMRTHRPLELIDFNKENAKRLLERKLGWRDYGGTHYESTFTKFFQAFYLPTKFGYDKRKAHLSSLVISKQMTGERALKDLEKELYQMSWTVIWNIG